MKTDEAFGHILRELRLERQFSQEDLAARSNVSRQHISRLELGGNSPSLSLLFELATALGVLPEDLVARVRARMSRSAS